jgi:predicted nucleic acid-binding protein
MFEKVEWVMAIGLPLKDAPILASAVSAGADYLVTEDKQHFSLLYGRIVGAMEILDPKIALSRLL